MAVFVQTNVLLEYMHRLWLLDNWVCNLISKIGGLR